jgi:hypothetical protein
MLHGRPGRVNGLFQDEGSGLELARLTYPGHPAEVVLVDADDVVSESGQLRARARSGLTSNQHHG